MVCTIKDGQGYLAICEQPWDAFYYVDHPAGGPYTHIGVRWVPSLGLMRYKRCIRMIFQEIQIIQRFVKSINNI